ncbi:RE1-silencing transcription factor B-like [Onthophagus taurus]|uniref:RE1-silencing transcription factor B-like n=1 Tax=Onthophagus taurus TaxID=166361 RepID=UPI0039BDD117
MDVAKFSLWNALLTNGICTIPTAYFVQGTANVHVLTYGNDQTTSSLICTAQDSPQEIIQDVQEDSRVHSIEGSDGNENNEVIELDDDEEEDFEEGDETGSLEPNEVGVVEDESWDKNDDDEQQNRRKIHRNRYSREEYKCITCPYTCTTEKAFIHHLRNCCAKQKDDVQDKPLEISCPICGKDRKGEESMTIHMKKHKDNRHFCCDICKFKTLQLKKLIQHRRMHTGEKPHLCPFCSYRSARRDNLRSHARRVHKKDSLPCDTFRPRNMILEPSK